MSVFFPDHQNCPWRPIPAPQSGPPWKTDGPAVQSSEPASVAAEARPLSPAAQAVKDHFLANIPITLEHGLAAALRAALNFSEYLYDSQYVKIAVVRVADLETWATELEGSND